MINTRYVVRLRVHHYENWPYAQNPIVDLAANSLEDSVKLARKIERLYRCGVGDQWLQREGINATIIQVVGPRKITITEEVV